MRVILIAIEIHKKLMYCFSMQYKFISYAIHIRYATDNTLINVTRFAKTRHNSAYKNLQYNAL